MRGVWEGKSLKSLIRDGKVTSRDSLRNPTVKSSYPLAEVEDIQPSITATTGMSDVKIPSIMFGGGIEKTDSNYFDSPVILKSLLHPLTRGFHTCLTGGPSTEPRSPESR